MVIVLDNSVWTYFAEGYYYVAGLFMMEGLDTICNNYGGAHWAAMAVIP